jgi:hypothetical protein
MRGYDLYNFPAFDAARDRFTAAGWAVISPADLDRQFEGIDPRLDSAHACQVVNGWTLADHRRVAQRDLDAILSLNADAGDALAILPGWERSSGALTEFCCAHWCRLSLLSAKTLQPLKTYNDIAILDSISAWLGAPPCPPQPRCNCPTPETAKPSPLAPSATSGGARAGTT